MSNTLRAIAIAVLLSNCVNSKISSTDKKSKLNENPGGVKSTIELKTGAILESVFDRNLVLEDLEPHSVILESGAHWKSNVNHRNFNGPVLGYVTPWNGAGYDAAKTFGNKFTFISPVWLQIKRKPSGTFYITGTHDIDHNIDWVAEVRKRGKKSQVKIVPRILFDGWSSDDYYKLFTTGNEPKELIKTIITSLKAYKLDGMVLEVWSQLGGQGRKALQVLVKQIGDAMKTANLTFILVIPPPLSNTGEGSAMIEHSDMKHIWKYVDYFSIMTYDFSHPERPGGNSPIDWISKCVESLAPTKQERSKFLIGLNFYGYDYTSTGGHAIFGKEYIDLLRHAAASESKMTWSSDIAEHFFETRDDDRMKHTVFYPTLYSIQKRIELAKKLDCGLAIWELGQGLPYFFDLL